MGASIPIPEANCTSRFCLNRFISHPFHLARNKACKEINIHYCILPAVCTPGVEILYHSTQELSLSPESEVVRHVPAQDSPVGRLHGVLEIKQRGLEWATGHPPPCQWLLSNPESSPRLYFSHTGSSVLLFECLIFWMFRSGWELARASSSDMQGILWF